MRGETVDLILFLFFGIGALDFRVRATFSPGPLFLYLYFRIQVGNITHNGIKKYMAILGVSSVGQRSSVDACFFQDLYVLALRDWFFWSRRLAPDILPPMIRGSRQ